MKRTLKQAILHEEDQRTRAALRAQRKSIAAYLRELRKRRTAAVRAARAHCVRSRARASARVADIRRKADVEIADIRKAAKDACSKRTAAARKRGLSEAQRAEEARREALAAERALTAYRRRRKPTTTRSERRLESDDEVRDNITPELRRAWDKMRTSIKPKPRISRTEQFLQWVEENPEEAIALNHPEHDPTIEREAEAELQRLERALAKGKLTSRDWSALGTSPAELESLGFNPRDPHDVQAYLTAYADHWDDLASAVPF